MNTFSQRLIALRKEKGMTQGDLAQALCKKRSTISGYETEGKETDFETLCLIAKYFNVSVDYMLGVSNCRSNTDDVLYRDNINFKKHYDSLPAELKIVAARIYDDFYVMLNRDIQTANAERLNVYADLFKRLREGRSDIKTRIELSGDTSDPMYLSEVMAMQNNLKNDTAVALDRLMQADMETVHKTKNEVYRELSDKPAM